jgi:uncharacterized protein (DUF1697 family)
VKLQGRPAGLPRHFLRSPLCNIIISMTRYFAFLRAINAGRGRSLTMESLRRAFEPLGLANVSTFIGSGNVIFDAPSADAAVLEKQIELCLREALGLEVDTFLRTAEELAHIASAQPFPPSHSQPADELEVAFLAEELEEVVKQQVKKLGTATDEYAVEGREIYWLRHRGPGASKYSTLPLERVLKRPFTIRNLRTVQKMLARFGGENL